MNDFSKHSVQRVAAASSLSRDDQRGQPLNSGTASEHLTRRGSILIVEDEVLIRAMISEYLCEAGHCVTEALNADKALEILNSEITVDVLLTDVCMPGSINGLGLLRYSREAFPQLPVIVMSGHLSAAEAIDQGAAHFIRKPYLFDCVLRLVEQALAETR